MSKTFRLWDVDQSWLLPLSVHEFVPAGHLAHFVRDTVREALDLSAISQAYPEERGQPPCLASTRKSTLNIACNTLPCTFTQMGLLTLVAAADASHPRRPNDDRSRQPQPGLCVP